MSKLSLCSPSQAKATCLPSGESAGSYSRPAPGANYDEVVGITAKYTEARPEAIRLGFPFQDRNGRLLVTDIERQMQWWTENGFMKRTIPLKGIVDTSFVEEAARAVPEK